MKDFGFWIFICLIPSLVLAQSTAVSVQAPALANIASGRLYLAFSRTDEDEPRFSIGWPVARTEATQVYAMDMTDWDGSTRSFLPSAGYPQAEFSALQAGDWFVQALFDHNDTLPDLNAPGNLYSTVVPLRILSDSPLSLSIVLDQAEPPEALPENTDYIKYVKIRSDLLSGFYGRDIHLRAAVMLPESYLAGSTQSFPVLYHIDGLNGRYTGIQRLWRQSAFREFWTDVESPQVVLVFLDGLSPWGDSYQVNRDISGPYADANFDELFPYLADNFPIRNDADSRFLTGCSTGGWVSMALQVFYPDYFAGSWPFSPDSPTFKAFQLVNLYDDENAFYNEYGMLRPSMREEDGEPLFGVRDEIAAESMIGRGDNFLYSGQQWASWNVVYGQLDEKCEPIPIWNPVNGEINKAAVEGWKPWDIDQYLRDNWSEIGESLAGKLHFTMGDMDNFYLNVGLRMLEQSLAELSDPQPAATFTWVPGQGHCGFGLEAEYLDVLRAIDASIQGQN